MRIPDKQPDAPKNKGGRPFKVIDPDLVEKLCNIACTDEEIADICGVSHDTLSRRRQQDPEFGALMANARAKGKASLRRLQMKAAEQGNAAMLIWLGKQMLGQRDRFDDAMGGKDPLPWQD